MGNAPTRVHWQDPSIMQATTSRNRRKGLGVPSSSKDGRSSAASSDTEERHPTPFRKASEHVVPLGFTHMRLSRSGRTRRRCLLFWVNTDELYCCCSSHHDCISSPLLQNKLPPFSCVRAQVLFLWSVVWRRWIVLMRFISENSRLIISFANIISMSIHPLQNLC